MINKIILLIILSLAGSVIGECANCLPEFVNCTQINQKNDSCNCIKQLSDCYQYSNCWTPAKHKFIYNVCVSSNCRWCNDTYPNNLLQPCGNCDLNFTVCKNGSSEICNCINDLKNCYQQNLCYNVSYDVVDLSCKHNCTNCYSDTQSISYEFNFNIVYIIIGIIATICLIVIVCVLSYRHYLNYRKSKYKEFQIIDDDNDEIEVLV
jgi:hypothetical protein